MTAAFDESSRADEEAILGILLTSFVILLLAIGTMTFSRDVNSLVIIPIEKMVQLVREISANPLGKKFSFSTNEFKGTDDGMEIAHNFGERSGPRHRAQQVVGVINAGHPVAHRLIDRVLQGAAARRDRNNIGTKQSHSGHVQCLPLGIFFAHVDRALKVE